MVETQNIKRRYKLCIMEVTPKIVVIRFPLHQAMVTEDNAVAVAAVVVLAAASL